MAHRIEVRLRPGVRDPLGAKVARAAATHLGFQDLAVSTVEVYVVDGDLTSNQLEQFAKGPLSDPIVQRPVIDESAALLDPDAPHARPFDWLVEVGYRPGVTDNTGRTATEALDLLLGHEGPKVYSARQYLLSGTLTETDAQRLASELLANDLIQTTVILSRDALARRGRITALVPKVIETARIQVERIDLERSDSDLIDLSRTRVLALNVDEMKTIAAHFRNPSVQADREPFGLDARITDVELECLAQTWSEHCKHKIFNAIIEYEDRSGEKKTIESIFDTYIKAATKEVRRSLADRDYCLSVFNDNAGVIEFTKDWSLVFKVETHNSPSALDPYGGALTGIVGVNRDPFGTGMGARLLFNTDIFCLAPPKQHSDLPPRLLQPIRVLEGVREGVEHGGNKSGIPTVNGAVVFDERYLGKPLVYCGTGGIMPSRIAGKPSHEKAARPGDHVIMVGGRIGKDGIHGATFSSEQLHEGSPATAVQIGDPITQKRMFDMLLLARDEGLYHSITDNGAGGLSSSVGEMAQQSGGVDLDLAKAPLKYSSLQPWEILVSESQERMTLAVPSEKMERLRSLAQRYQVELSDLGTFDASGWFTVRYEGDVVARLDMDFLHDGLPAMRLRGKAAAVSGQDPALEDRDPNRTLITMMGRLNVASKEYWIRQYDHEVGGGSVVKPLMGRDQQAPSDAAVIRPVLGRPEAVVVSNGLCPRYSDIDAGAMAAAALDEAVRNAVCVGADPDRLAALDNFCWPDPVEGPDNPDGAHKLAQLIEANEALYNLCVAYGIPLISGKDSMKNDYRAGDVKISVPPTLLVSVVGRMLDAAKAVTSDAKKPGDSVFVVGTTLRELGGSEYLAAMDEIGASVPRVRPKEHQACYRAIHQAIDRGLIRSCHDCSDGGLAVALAETALGGQLGMDIDLRSVPQQGEQNEVSLLYAESTGRFVLTAAPDAERELADLFEGLPFSRIGTTRSKPRFLITGLAGASVVDLDLDAVGAAWRTTLNL
ncbi:MAG: phosphoribosylformylglycinamidine synthase [Deltaproteobacteria bacterium]|nr:phosphoribosylformylglycinamidine synthase [Deltaproteobacteria bacterium]